MINCSKNRKGGAKIRKGVMVFLMVLATFLNGSKTYAENNQSQSSQVSWPVGPEINSRAAIVMDADSGMILYEKNILEKMYPASTTKIMTAMLAIEQCPLTDVVVCSSTINDFWKGDYQYTSRIGLVGGEELVLKDALYGTLLASGNDVAYAIAEHVGGGNIDTFIQMMNDRAKEIGCRNTHFENPHGLDDHIDTHYSCAYDMALIMRNAITLPDFCKISNTRSYTIPATNKNVERPVLNTHKMIKRETGYEYEGIIAGKTGFTDKAKYCIVTACERDGVKLIVVVMGCDGPDTATRISNVYNDTKTLLDYGFDSFRRVTLSGKEIMSGNEDLNLNNVLKLENSLLNSIESPIDISDVDIVIPSEATVAEVTKQVVLIPLSEYKDGINDIGRIDYYFGNKYLGSAKLTYEYFEEEKTEYISEISDDTETVDIKPEISKEEKENQNNFKDFSDLRLKLITIVVGGALVMSVLYLLFVQIPKEKRKR